ELVTVFSEIYPIARLDDLNAVRDLSRDQLGSLFLSGLFFSTAGTDAGSDAAGRAFSKRVRDKLTALLSKESGPLKDEFLAAVEAFAARSSPRGACTYDNSQIPGHPIPEVRAALEKGSRAKAMTAFFLAPSLERGLERLPRLDQEQKGIVMRSLTEGIEASIASIRNDIKRDYACNDPEQVMKDIDFLTKVNTALRQTEEFYDLADNSFAQPYREKAQRLQSYQEEDRISIERNQPSATLYLSQKYASAPKVQESKEFIRGYFGLEPERTRGRGFTSEPQVVLSPYSDWAEWMKEPSRKITPEQSGRVTGDFVYKLHSSCRIVIEDTDILRLVGVTETSSSHDAAFEVVCPGETRVFFIYPNSGKYSVLNVHAER
ncbi:MAG: hypothetical protein IJV54_02500, partial [Bacteroidales bacterium]|nr:hypothetical protein [Bacteroidales bacterium]